MGITRQQYWSFAYRARRYLSHLDADELKARSQDILANAAALTPQGQLWTHSPLDPHQFPWIKLWGEVSEEFGARGLALPGDFVDRDVLPRPTFPKPARGSSESRLSSCDLSKSLLKFGGRGWLSEALKTGQWLVSPASYYSDPSLCKARKDSEMLFPLSVALLSPTQEPADGLDGDYKHILTGKVERRLVAESDFYLVSLSRSMIYRMFDDFQADACLVINDEDEFQRRMLRAFADANPGWSGRFDKVKYADPCAPVPPLDVHFAKHFRYSYQTEERFVWIPPLRTVKLQRFSINLGPLEDICELLALD